MKIEKIGEYKVRCRMSAEEMTEFDMHTEDFTGRTEKLHEFIGHILDRVRDELGMEMGGMLSAQIVGSAGKDVTIILTNEVGQVKGDLKDDIGRVLKDAYENIEQGILSEGLELPEDFSVDNTLKKAFEMIAKGEIPEDAVAMPFITPERERKTPAAKPVRKDRKDELSIAIYSFSSLMKAEEFIRTLNGTRLVRLSLYKVSSGDIHMVIRRCKEPQNGFAGICASALEFGEFVSHDRLKLEYLKEHSKVLFDNKKIDFIKEFI